MNNRIYDNLLLLQEAEHDLAFIQPEFNRLLASCSP